MYLAAKSSSDMILGIDWMRLLCVSLKYATVLTVALVCGLMNEDPEARITVEEAMQHPWVTRYRGFTPPADPLDQTEYCATQAISQILSIWLNGLWRNYKLT
jgi:serine/threonine protein kinase